MGCADGDDLVGVEKRLQQLAEGDTMHGYVRMDGTDEGVYYLVLRSWPHPDVEDATTLSLRYAYLTRGDGSDGWVEEGVNMRVSSDVDPAEACKQVARLMMGGSKNFDADGAGRLWDFDVRDGGN